MKHFVLALTVALTLAPLSTPAQETAKKEAAQPPLSSSQVLLDNWNDIGRKLIAMAEDFPESKYDFKPTPVQRSFAEQLLHAASGNYYFINPYLGQKMPEGDVKRSDYKTKADVVAYLKKSFADGAALIKQKGDAGLGELMMDPFLKRQARLSDEAWSIIEHSGEHYGQLVVYYRLAGLVPPESRPK